VSIWSFALDLDPKMIAGEPQDSDLRFDEVHWSFVCLSFSSKRLLESARRRRRRGLCLSMVVLGRTSHQALPFGRSNALEPIFIC